MRTLRSHRPHGTISATSPSSPRRSQFRHCHPINRQMSPPTTMLDPLRIPQLQRNKLHVIVPSPFSTASTVRKVGSPSYLNHSDSMTSLAKPYSALASPSVLESDQSRPNTPVCNSQCVHTRMTRMKPFGHGG